MLWNNPLLRLNQVKQVSLRTNEQRTANPYRWPKTARDANDILEQLRRDQEHARRKYMEARRAGDRAAEQEWRDLVRTLEQDELAVMAYAQRAQLRANPLSELWASSKERYRASAKEKRLYGGSTVTEFYVGRKGDENDASKWVVQVGYGKTPGERKTDAMRRAAPRLGVTP